MPPPERHARSTAVYACAIFLSAFLLFQVQPIVAKSILPWFGGTAAVWSTCLAFFQVVLLLGYLYATWSCRYLTATRQAWVHLTLLIASLLLLPVLPSSNWKPSASGDPTLRILGLLAATVGLPYFVLSTTGPLLQAWYADDRPLGTPYRLFALSNAGSMIALLTYPVLVEPVWGARLQAIGWSAVYSVFVATCSWIALGRKSSPDGAGRLESVKVGGGVGWERLLFWFALPACASVLLLGVTSHLSQDVAPVPFLWLFPLALYLLSFVICFDSDRWYRRPVWVPATLLALSTLAYGLYGDYSPPRLPATVAAVGAAFFACCMFCHGELARVRPPAGQLTIFYLMVAAGGAAGGVFVGLLAPRIFNTYLELPIGLLMCAALIVILTPAAPPDRLRRLRWHPLWLGTAVWAVALAWYLGTSVRDVNAEARVTARNFYGALRVVDQETEAFGTARSLMHGQITHGTQLLDSSRRRMPTTYYGPKSAIGLLFANSAERPTMRVGVMGLGAGALAAYSRKGDFYRFYEINPIVPVLARTEFTFLADSPASIDIVPGDARLSLEHEPGQELDLLAMDAFSGDSIPVHLVTKEALELYFRHLKPDGILAVHISNKYIDLVPVMELAARALGKAALLIDVDIEEDEDWVDSSTTWVLMSGDPAVLQRSPLREAASHFPPTRSGVRLWTDDYSNLWRVLK